MTILEYTEAKLLTFDWNSSKACIVLLNSCFITIEKKIAFSNSSFPKVENQVLNAEGTWSDDTQVDFL